MSFCQNNLQNIPSCKQSKQRLWGVWFNFLTHFISLLSNWWWVYSWALLYFRCLTFSLTAQICPCFSLDIRLCLGGYETSFRRKTACWDIDLTALTQTRTNVSWIRALLIVFCLIFDDVCIFDWLNCDRSCFNLSPEASDPVWLCSLAWTSVFFMHSGAKCGVA